jgi:hypothetical protein
MGPGSAMTQKKKNSNLRQTPPSVNPHRINRWRVFILIFFVCGCTSLPKKSIEEKSGVPFLFPAMREDLWKATIGTLGVEFVPIAIQDETEGTIETESFPVQKPEFTSWTTGMHMPSEGWGKLYFIVKQGEAPELSELEIVTEFTKARGLALPEKRLKSSGIFEEALAAKIHAFLIAQEYPTLHQLAIGCTFEWDQEVGRYRIARLESGGFGEEQGFQEGDIVVRLDDIEMSLHNFFPALAEIRENTKRTFTVLRHGALLTLSANIYFLSPDLPWVGMRIERDPISYTFTVEDVAPSSPAGHAGIQIGDKILEEEGIALVSWNNYYQAVTSTQADMAKRLVIERDGMKLALYMTPKPFEPKKSGISGKG